eukprot:GHVL01014469.1.p2 GENE.GHVL01014469.1~~GHVL01014469.1.p2  ORF type:complete len:133 (+),score=27.09 GHVL01014469.1:776-1174(+)
MPKIEKKTNVLLVNESWIVSEIMFALNGYSTDLFFINNHETADETAKKEFHVSNFIEVRLTGSYRTSGMSVSCLLSILERWIHYISIISTARLLCNETINADPTETQRTALCFEIKKLIDDFDKKVKRFICN